jgi:membrane-bound serine protease (ClpP class)
MDNNTRDDSTRDDQIMFPIRIRFNSMNRLWLAVLFLLGLATSVLADESKEAATPVKENEVQLPLGFIVNVPLPLTGDSDERIIAQLRSVIDQPKDSKARPVVILHFKAAPKVDIGNMAAEPKDPNQVSAIGSGSSFERALSLARFIASPEAAGIKAVAFATDPVEGHALLPLLACEQILLGTNASLGSVVPGKAVDDETISAAYQQIVKRRRTLPEAVINGMLNPAAGVFRLEMVNGEIQFVNANLREQMREKGELWNESEVAKAGSTFRLTTPKLLELKLLQSSADSFEDIVKVLQLAGLPQDAATPIGKLKGVIVNIEGHLHLRRVATLIHGMQKAIDAGTNLFVFRINSEGGSVASSLQLATFIANLDPTKVITVAYVDGNARGDAAWVVAACRQRWMAPTSHWGGAGEATIGLRELEEARKPLDELATRSKIDLSTLMALSTPDVQIANYRHKLDGRKERFTPTVLEDRMDSKQWEEVTKLNWKEGIKANEAFNEGLCLGELKSIDEIPPKFKLDQPLSNLQLPWLEMQVQRLANSGGLKTILLMIAIAALMSELGTPGLGVAGFISLLAFSAYFWLQFFNGTLAWLEIFLFVGGVVCLLVEFTVLPGFGIFGVGGIIMLGSALVLASQTFVLPTNSYQLDRFSWNMLGIAVLSASVLVTAFVFRKEIERVLRGKEIALAPGGTADLEALERKESMVDWNHLLDQEGLTVTRLLPSGKARFGDQLISVITDGEVIDAHQRVRVTAVRGNTVMVALVA